MKLRYMNSLLLLETWKAGVETLFFPESLVQELRPGDHLDSLDDLPLERERHRKKIDAFIDQVFEIDIPENYWSLLRKTDQKLVSLYFDRILSATFAIEHAIRGKEVVEVPASWTTLSYMLLSQKLFQ